MGGGATSNYRRLCIDHAARFAGVPARPPLLLQGGYMMKPKFSPIHLASLLIMVTLFIAPLAAADDFFPGWRSRSWPQTPPPLVGWNLVIDPGHGGKDGGAGSCSGTSICEKVFNLAISQKLESILTTYGANVSMTRTADVDMTLDERIAFSNNAGAHRFLSVHINAAGSAARGIETWVDAPGVDTTLNPTTAAVWRAYAQTVHDNLVIGARTIDSTIPNRGLKFSGTTPPWGPGQGRIRVIRSDLNNSPAALVEVNFISNSADYALLLRDDYQLAVAHGMSQGFLDHAEEYGPQDGLLRQ